MDHVLVICTLNSQHYSYTADETSSPNKAFINMKSSLKLSLLIPRRLWVVASVE